MYSTRSPAAKQIAGTSGDDQCPPEDGPLAGESVAQEKLGALQSEVPSTGGKRKSREKLEHAQERISALESIVYTQRHTHQQQTEAIRQLRDEFLKVMSWSLPASKSHSTTHSSSGIIFVPRTF